MIVTVTPNPSVDRTYLVGAPRPGQLHRARAVGAEASGKGVNASTRRSAGGPSIAGLSEEAQEPPQDHHRIAGHERDGMGGRRAAASIDRTGRRPIDGAPPSMRGVMTTGRKRAVSAPIRASVMPVKGKFLRESRARFGRPFGQQQASIAAL
jgi:hypothetical protein